MIYSRLTDRDHLPLWSAAQQRSGAALCYVCLYVFDEIPAGGDPLVIGVEDDLQEDAGIIGRGAGIVVLAPKVEYGQVYFIVDEIVEGVLEGAGENLFVEADRDEFAL